MLDIKCKVKRSALFTELLPFQGSLKTRTDEDLRKLCDSLLNDGLLMPFVVWHKPMGNMTGEQTVEAWHDSQPHYLLDGHARYAAVQELAKEDPELLTARYPIIIVEADDIETAKNQLLQITSSYGKITAKGLQAFVANSPKIKVESLGIKVKLPGIKVPAQKKASEEASHAVLRVKIPTERVAQVLEVLKSCSFVEIL